MRPFSLYLDSVKQAPLVICEMNMAGTTPPIPSVPATVAFEAEESRRSEAQRWVLRDLSELLGVGTDRLGLSVGSSSGLLHALSAVTSPGDVVAIEKPFYEPFVMAARYLGLKVVFFSRTGDFARDLVELRRVAGRAGVLLISNPSSPAGWMYSSAEIRRAASLFDYVLVDEIFLPVFSREISRTGSIANVISVSGLSKTLGLSSLRVGWIKASVKILRACDQIALNTYVDVPTLSLVGASMVLPRFWEIVDSHRARAEANRSVLRGFGERVPDVLSHDFSSGHFGVLKVPRRFKTASAFARALTRESVGVCPCEPFGWIDRVRFSSFLEPARFSRAFSIIERHYARG